VEEFYLFIFKKLDKIVNCVLKNVSSYCASLLMTRPFPKSLKLGDLVAQGNRLP
jgi:hypothetical protein